MNRFDASTIWNSGSDKLADGAECESFIGDDSPSDEQSELSIGDSPPHDGEDSSSWSASLRAQTFFVPLHYEANYRYPLIVWLHSDGFNENQVCQVMPHISSRNYLATGLRAPMSLDSSGHRFSWSDSGAALKSAEQCVLEAIDRAATQYSVHAERIVLAGYQRGGSMATRIAMQHPEMFAAAISLGGSFDLPDESELDRQRLRARRLPMLWQRSLDAASYCESDLVAEISAANSIGAQLEIRQYRNDDEMNTVVLSDLDRWVMNHVVCGARVGKMNRWDTSPTSFSDN